MRARIAEKSSAARGRFMLPPSGSPTGTRTNFEYHNPLSPAERYLERMPNVQSSRVVPSTQGIDRGHIRGTTLYMPRERRHNPAKALQHIPFRMTRPSGSRHVQMPYSSSLL